MKHAGVHGPFKFDDESAQNFAESSKQFRKQLSIEIKLKKPKLKLKTRQQIHSQQTKKKHFISSLWNSNSITQPQAL